MAQSITVSRICDEYYYGISAALPIYLNLDPVTDKILDKMNHCSDLV